MTWLDLKLTASNELGGEESRLKEKPNVIFGELFVFRICETIPNYSRNNFQRLTYVKLNRGHEKPRKDSYVDLRIWKSFHNHGNKALS